MYKQDFRAACTRSDVSRRWLHCQNALLTWNGDFGVIDNSNLQGTSAVSACVVFKNGHPSKKDYRYFNIKTVKGPDDYASMEEVIYRRYKRVLGEENGLPKLIVVVNFLFFL